MCLGECTLSVRHSCTCIPTDDHTWQRYTDSVHVCSSFVGNFPWCSLTQRTLANGEQTRPNTFVHVCCKVHTWRMHTFASIWPNTFAKCIYAAFSWTSENIMKGFKRDSALWIFHFRFDNVGAQQNVLLNVTNSVKNSNSDLMFFRLPPSRNSLFFKKKIIINQKLIMKKILKPPKI